MKLCDHVDTEQEGEVVTIARGVATPFYGWSPELQADVPLLQCTACAATTRLPGSAVRRSTWPPAQEGWDLL